MNIKINIDCQDEKDILIHLGVIRTQIKLAIKNNFYGKDKLELVDDNFYGNHEIKINKKNN